MADQEDAGLGSQLGSGRRRRRAGDPEALRRADALFDRALEHLQASRWPEAEATLHELLGAMPYYPQARGLLALVEDASRSLFDDSPQIMALRAYVRELIAADERPSAEDGLPSPRRRGTAELGRPLSPPSEATLDDQPPLFRPPLEPVAAPPERPPEAEVLPSPPSSPSPFILLKWLFFSPARFHRYRRAAGDVIPSGAAWLAGSFLYLPLLTIALVLALVNILSPGYWGAVIAVVALWGLVAWIAQYGGGEAVFPLVGSTAFLLLFFLVGRLSLAGSVAAVVALTMAMGIALGIAIYLLEIEVGRAVSRFASGVAVVVATVLVAVMLFFLSPFLRNLMGGLLESPLGAALAGYLIGGTVALAVFLVGFGLVLGAVSLLMMPPAFLTALAFEGNPLTDRNVALRLVLLAFLALACLSLAVICLLSGLPVLS